jgi:hypothetical protein
MGSQSIISAIDAEIASLQQAKALLEDEGKVSRVTTRITAKKLSAKQPKKRAMSAEARKRIGDAQRKRWAATKKQASAAPSKATKNASL